VLPHGFGAGDLAGLERSPIPVAISVVDPGCPGPGGYHSHFPEQGFTTDGAALDRLAALLEGGAAPGALRWIALRIPHDQAAWVAVHRAHQLANNLGLEAMCHVELPRGTELHPPTDPHAGSRCVTQALLAAAALPDAVVLLDGLLDKDRGYHPRPGLLDRRCNPNPAARVLRSLARLLDGAPSVRQLAPGRFAIAERELWLQPQGPGPWWCLERDAEQIEAPQGPAVQG
jgi:hypothetical protein